MTRVLIIPVVCLSLALTSTACSRTGDKNQEAAYKENAARALPDKDQVEVTGCLAASSDANQFVLTADANALASLANRAANGATDTYHYQLVGGTDLQQYVGKEVTVKGSLAGTPKDVDIEHKDKTVKESPTRDKDGDKVTPAIESKAEIDLNVARLNVASVTPTGGACKTAAQ